MIHKPSITAKLDLLFRMILEVQKNTFEPTFDVSNTLNAILSFGVQIIHETREDSWQRNEQYLDEAGKAIQIHFSSMLKEIFSELNSGLPITLTIGKEQLIIKDGIERLANDLEKVYNGEEIPLSDFPDEEDLEDPGHACRVCGCTQFRACAGGCYWVEEDLCSKCVDK